MSRKLVNEFTWSFSRDRLFQSCKRAYYWKYYGAWDGWLGNAPESAQMAYRLKNLSGLPLWRGSLVHNAIKYWLELCNGVDKMLVAQKVFDLQFEKAVDWMNLTANRQWTTSVKRMFLQNPKRNLTLAEHYYPHLADRVGKHTIDTVKNDAALMLNNFRVSPLYKAICEAGPLHWHTFEQLQSIPVRGIKVWIVMDFAWGSRKHKFVIVDWKTGKTQDSDLDQLTLYRMAAPVLNPGISIDDVAVMDVYLAPDPIQIASVSPQNAALLEDPKTVSAKIAASTKQMAKTLVAKSLTNNQPQEDLDEYFPQVSHNSSSRSCTFCNYFRFCHGGGTRNEKEIY